MAKTTVSKQQTLMLPKLFAWSFESKGEKIKNQ